MGATKRKAVKHSVLWVDDDEATLDLGRRLLQLEGFLVFTARTGGEARDVAEQHKPDIALIDLRLPDDSGVEVLRRVRAAHPTTVCTIVTGFATCRSTVEAMKLGAFDVLEKPLFGDALLEFIHKAAARLHAAGSCEQHGFRRWAELVFRSVASPSDPRTLLQWGRAVGVSRGALRNWCYTAGISARRSLLFARVLRAIIRHEQTHAAFEQLLDVVDRRTLTKLAMLSGSREGVFPSTVATFLAQQRLVTERAAVDQIAAIYREASTQVDSEAPRSVDLTSVGNGFPI